MSEIDPGFLDQKYLVDPYANWARDEGVPIHAGRTLDLLAVDTQPWGRFGMQGAICHVDGRCDFLSVFVFDLPAGGASAPVHHVYEECIVALSGSGRTRVTLSNGRETTIEWRAGQAFAVPVNATHRHENDGAAPARLVAFNDLRYLMGLYRNEAFLFANGGGFEARQAKAVEAGLLAVLVDDGARGRNEPEPRAAPLGDMAIGLDLWSLRAGERSRARRQMQGRHMLCLGGEGSTFSFASASSDLERIDWRRGMLAGLTGMAFHQHVASGPGDLRLLSVELGSMASPMFRSRRAAYGDREVYASGAAEIPPDEERADISAWAVLMAARP